MFLKIPSYKQGKAFPRVLFYEFNRHGHQWDKKYNSYDSKQLPSDNRRDQRIERRKPYRAAHYSWLDQLVFYKLDDQINNQALDRRRRADQKGQNHADRA